MKIKFLREATNGETGEQIAKGEIIDLGDARNKNAVERGMAEYVEEVEKKVVKPKTEKK